MGTIKTFFLSAKLLLSSFSIVLRGSKVLLFRASHACVKWNVVDKGSVQWSFHIGAGFIKEEAVLQSVTGQVLEH